LQEAIAEGPFRILIHCFSSSQYLSDKAVELGGYISASGIITFKKSQALRDSFKSVPLERLLVETDSPYLAPEPHRGKPCEPAFTAYTARKLAEVKSVSIEELIAATTNNFFTLFSKAKRP
jgi:TatD DNase family protein